MLQHPLPGSFGTNPLCHSEIDLSFSFWGTNYTGPVVPRDIVTFQNIQSFGETINIICGSIEILGNEYPIIAVFEGCDNLVWSYLQLYPGRFNALEFDQSTGELAAVGTVEYNHPTAGIGNHALLETFQYNFVTNQFTFVSGFKAVNASYSFEAELNGLTRINGGPLNGLYFSVGRIVRSLTAPYLTDHVVVVFDQTGSVSFFHWGISTNTTSFRGFIDVEQISTNEVVIISELLDDPNNHSTSDRYGGLTVVDLNTLIGTWYETDNSMPIHNWNELVVQNGSAFIVGNQLTDNSYAPMTSTWSQPFLYEIANPANPPLSGCDLKGYWAGNDASGFRAISSTNNSPSLLISGGKFDGSGFPQRVGLLASTDNTNVTPGSPCAYDHSVPMSLIRTIEFQGDEYFDLVLPNQNLTLIANSSLKPLINEPFNCAPGFFKQADSTQSVLSETLDSSSAFTIYPNPTSDFLTLSVLNEATDDMRFEVYSLEGKVVHTGRVNGQETQIDMSELAKGVYSLVMKQSGQMIRTERIVKN